MSLSTSLPDFKSRALAALNAGQIVSTSAGFARQLGFDSQGNASAADLARPFAVTTTSHKTTRHESAALAVACLATL